MSRIDQKTQGTRPRMRTAAFFVLGLSTGCLLTVVGSYAIAQIAHYQVHGDVLPEVVSGADAMEASRPVALRIPRLDTEASFEEPLGVKEDGAIEVPEAFDTVGWYKHGPTPGELGPAVVLGHIDSLEGPAVFYQLGQLEPGDRIFIEREDGTTAEFIVDGLKRYAREEFPTEAVYGDLAYPGLRLITCSGTYDQGEQVYSHNLVVYAQLANGER